MKSRGKLFLLMMMVLIIGMIATGCLKEYEKDLLVEASSNETLILVPLLGDNLESQEMLNSLEYLEKNRIAQKRVEINQEWYSTGRRNNAGTYIPVTQAIIVDRTPVNVEWTSDERGSSTKDEGIRGEDRNSISFNADWYVTATVLEEDAHKYLYWYGVDKSTAMEKSGWTYAIKSRKLDSVVNTEVKRMVADLFTSLTGQRNLRSTEDDEGNVIESGIIDGKDEIVEEIKKIVTREFKEKGITITAVGWTGDINYEDRAVQDAINQEFLEERQAAAQRQINRRKLEQAENEVAVATQERIAAEERQKTWEIMKESRELDILEEYIGMLNEKWDGKYPQTLLQPGADSNQPFILDVPMPD